MPADANDNMLPDVYIIMVVAMTLFITRLCLMVVVFLAAAGIVPPAQAIKITVPNIDIAGTGTALAANTCSGGWGRRTSSELTLCIVRDTTSSATYMTPSGNTLTLTPSSSYNNVEYPPAFNSTGATITAVSLKLWFCSESLTCTVAKGSPVTWGTATLNVDSKAPISNITFSPTAANFVTSQQHLGGCYTLNIAGKEYSPTDISGTVWCSDAPPFSTTQLTCHLYSAGDFSLDFGTVERSTIGSSPSSNQNGFWPSHAFTNCPYAATATLTVSNIFADSAGNGLIKTSIDGLGIGIRLQGAILKADGKLTPSVEAGFNSYKFAFILVNTKGDKLPAGDFTASSVITLDVP